MRVRGTLAHGVRGRVLTLYLRQLLALSTLPSLFRVGCAQYLTLVALRIRVLFAALSSSIIKILPPDQDVEKHQRE